jgi:uncharacterized protein
MNSVHKLSHLFVLDEFARPRRAGDLLSRRMKMTDTNLELSPNAELGAYRRAALVVSSARAAKQRIRTLFASGIFAASLSGAATAGPLEDGQAAFGRGDYAAAMPLLRPLAEEGNAVAQYQIGVMYALGIGAPQDHAQSLAWRRKAADHGYAIAQFSIGLTYQKGDGAPQDYAQALVWYRKAADQGYAAAQSRLGDLYGLGLGAPQDFEQALVWYGKAADQGYGAAQASLGFMYANGQGAPRDDIRALMWLSLAARNDERFRLRHTASRRRDELADIMTPAQTAEAQRMADERRPNISAQKATIVTLAPVRQSPDLGRWLPIDTKAFAGLDGEGYGHFHPGRLQPDEAKRKASARTASGAKTTPPQHSADFYPSDLPLAFREAFSNLALLGIFIVGSAGLGR